MENEERSKTKKAQREEMSVAYTHGTNCIRYIDEGYEEEEE